MAKIRFHKIAAVTVLVAVTLWVGTGEFSTVGSAQNEAAPTDAEARQAPPVVRTVAVVVPPRVDHSRAIRISGQTDANKRATLATRAAGVITELPAEQGRTVARGDTILTLDAEDKGSAIETGEALVKQREAEWEAARKLVRSGNLPRLQADNAWSALVAARSQLDSARAELARNQVVAPFDGIIDRVDVELGAPVMQGAPVATLISLDPILGKGEISERDLTHVRINDAAEVLLVSGETVDGVVRYISRDASAQTRTFRIEVAIPNKERAIPAGMTAEITLRSAPVEAVVLPRSVVTLSVKGDLGIRAVGKDDKVVFYPIDLVDDTPTGLVLAGIPADARVIVAGQDLVSDGDTVRPQEASAEQVRKLIGEASADSQ